jgi:hypothetical protein
MKFRHPITHQAVALDWSLIGAPPRAIEKFVHSGDSLMKSSSPCAQILRGFIESTEAQSGKRCSGKFAE